MSIYLDNKFIIALKTHPSHRTIQDEDILFAFLHGFEALGSLREPALRAICRGVRYEFHDANDILYCRGELATCWYILLAGSVFIDGSMYLPSASFGKRAAGCARRPNECLILEPSEMIAIDYPDIQLMKPLSHRSAAVSSHGFTPNGVERHVSSPAAYTSHVVHSAASAAAVQHGHRRMHSDSGSIAAEHVPPELLHVQNAIVRSEALLRVDGKRGSRASDTSSAYSGSDVMHSSADDGDVDLTGLQESLVDSDDEEGYCDGPESIPVHDAVRECLEKDPTERTDDDIEVLLEAMQHMPAFANMTLATRRRLCAVMVFAVVEKANTAVMNDQEELDSWSVILNGHVEISRPDGTTQDLHMGDSFGITPTTEKLLHYGTMRTKVDDCQFVCIAQEDYFRILNEGEENTRRHAEAGVVVLVEEHRELDGGNRKGHIVIRGTPERLMSHLVDEHSAVDPTYVEDFLLTYRTFLSSPRLVAQNLLDWFRDDKLRDRVTRVVLLWVNNHFNDFETQPDMNDFLEKFEALLEAERMTGQLRLLNIACAAKARPRTVVLTRATREEILHFSVLGGLERGTGIFISKVDADSKAAEAGLKRGDQILEVNNQNFGNIAHNRALEVLRGTTHLSVTVKSNLLAFKEMLATPENSPRRTPKKEHIARLQNDPKQRLAQLESSVQPVIQGQSKDKKGQKGFTVGNRTKIRRALMRMNLIPRSSAQANDSSLCNDDSSLNSRSRIGSQSSTGSSPLHGTSGLSASNPDLSSMGSGDGSSRHTEYPEHVIKVYKQDQSCKYFLIHRETSAREVVMLALREFGITDASNNFSLCEVTCELGGLVKTKRLPDQLTNLPERTTLNGRFYLRNNSLTDPLVPDDMQHDLMRDANVSLLQVQPAEVAAQLTLRDFQLFAVIEPTEYMDDLFDLESKYGAQNLNDFSELINKEMFWVVSEIVSESNLVKRMKIIKHFIKIARHCKECKNFNSMFALVSGLNYSAVTRLRASWDKLPTKYLRLFEDLKDLMDPSRNMSKYRNLVNSEHIQPPMIPFFPVVKKDLTFIHLGNDSKVEELVNFEKMRMVAKEVRHVCNMSANQSELSSILLAGASNSQSVFNAFSGGNASAMATLRRKKRSSTMPNAKKMHDEAQMVRRVRLYLDTIKVITDEKQLSEMSAQCEAPVSRKRDPSPSPPAPDAKKSVDLGPKFGVEEPQAVSKLLALSDKVRPHNNAKNPMPVRASAAAGSPNVMRRSTAQNSVTASPKPVRVRPPAVLLSPESSSVVGLSANKTLKKSVSSSNSVGSGGESASPTNSGGGPVTSQGDTDSGHSSVNSSNFDSNSSVSSQASPPRHPRTSAFGGLRPVSPSSRRPPLPPYNELVQNQSAYLPTTTGAHYLYHHNILSNTPAAAAASSAAPVAPPRSRPPLPDYAQATRMAQMARSRSRGPTRSCSEDGLRGVTYLQADDLDDLEIDEAVIDLDDDDENEQVSAV